MPKQPNDAATTPEAEALAMLAEAYPAAVGETIDLIASVDHQVRDAKAQHLGPEFRGIPSFLARVVSFADERAALVEKGGIIARAAGSKFDPPAADPILTDGEALADFLLSRGHQAVDDLHHFRETETETLRARLATLVETARGWVERHAAGPISFNVRFVRPTLHEAVAEAARAIAGARKLRGQLAVIDRPGDLTARQAASVSAAVDAAGGAEAVARGVAEASALEGLDAGRGEDGPAITALEAENAELVDSLRRLGVARGRAVAGSWAAKASARLDEIDAALDDAHGRVSARKLDDAAGLVDRAPAGDEPSRQAVYGLVARRPDCFAPGFGAALASAYGGRDSLLQLARALAG